jgi:hypothetical protein
VASEKISAMPTAGALTGAELIPIVQGGVNKKITLTALAAFLFQNCGVANGVLTWDNTAHLPTTLGNLHTDGFTGLVVVGEVLCGSLSVASGAFAVDSSGNLTQANGTIPFTGSGIFTTFAIINGIVTNAS